MYTWHISIVIPVICPNDKQLDSESQATDPSRFSGSRLVPPLLLWAASRVSHSETGGKRQDEEITIQEETALWFDQTKKRMKGAWLQESLPILRFFKHQPIQTNHISSVSDVGWGGGGGGGNLHMDALLPLLCEEQWGRSSLCFTLTSLCVPQCVLTQTCDTPTAPRRSGWETRAPRQDAHLKYCHMRCNLRVMWTPGPTHPALTAVHWLEGMQGLHTL